MKHLYIYIIALFLLSTSISAQYSEVKCYLALTKATQYFYGTDVITQDVVKARKILEVEAEKGCAEAMFRLGYNYYKTGYDYTISDVPMAKEIAVAFQDNTKKNAFKYLSASYKAGNLKAIAFLGNLYQEGIGCKLDFDKAIELYLESHSYNIPKAAYNLGYCYLKGLGNIEQDYEKAIEWFKKTDYSMAKHWLAVCYYFGYGTPVDKEKAYMLLNSVKVNTNSPTLLKYLEEIAASKGQGLLDAVSNQEVVAQTNEVNTILTTDEFTASEQITFKQLNINSNLKGEWTGKLIDLDFAGELITRDFPVNLTFKANAGKGAVGYTLTINNVEQKGTATTFGESLYFDNLTIELPRRYKDHVKIPTYIHAIQNMDIEIKSMDYVSYLTAYVEAFNQGRNEPSSPKLLVLVNNKFVTENGVELSKYFLEQLLAQQGDNFISLYPNPFKKDLLIQYELASASTVAVELYSLDGSFSDTITTNQTQTKGKKMFHYDGSTLNKGLYVVRVMVDGIKHTKLIAKQ